MMSFKRQIGSRPLTVQCYKNGLWVSERPHWSHYDSCVELIKHGDPKRIRHSKRGIIYKNYAARRLERDHQTIHTVTVKVATVDFQDMVYYYISDYGDMPVYCSFNHPVFTFGHYGVTQVFSENALPHFKETIVEEFTAKVKAKPFRFCFRIDELCAGYRWS